MTGGRNRSAARSRDDQDERLQQRQRQQQRRREWRQVGKQQSADQDEQEQEIFDGHDHEQATTSKGAQVEEEYNLEDEEWEDQEEDESHYLIGVGSAPPAKLLASSSGKQSPALSAGGDHSMERPGIFARLAGFLGAPTTNITITSKHKSRQPDEANLDDISTSDFTYEHQGSPAERLPGFYYEEAPDQEEQPRFLAAKRPSTPSNSRSHTRPLLMITLFLLLTLSTLMLLLRLLSLVQDERTRLGLDSELAGRRQDSLLSEISRNLDPGHRRQLEAERLSRWLVATSKCHIPVLDPWHPTIREYVRVKPPLNCTQLVRDELEKAAREKGHSASEGKSGGRKKKKKHRGKGADETQQTNIESLSYVKNNKLFLTERALKMGGLSGQASGTCCLKPIGRAPDSDDGLEPAEVCAPIQSQGVFPNASIVEINCPSWNYTNVHSFVVHSQEEEEALGRVASERLESTQHYNLLMLGVDTISRLNGQRQLNGTLSLLRDLYGTLDFVGYNKVGENTFPNLIPLLTGLKPAQLAEVQCWQTKNYTDESERGDDFLDNCKYLWSYFQQVGYMTYFSEDWPAASTMNYLKPGFKNQPTTFYGRPFTLARDKLLWPKFKSIGCASCQLDRPVVQVDLANLRAFIEHNDNKLPYFAFHWINCPQHDDLNGASQVDLILESFLRNLHPLAQRDRTFVIFFSDHGYRWNDFVSTRIGHYESSLPLLTIAPPKHFIEHHPQLYANLKDHQGALLTPFDMFKTLVALRDLGTVKQATTVESKDVRAGRAPGRSSLEPAKETPKVAAPSATASTEPYLDAATTISEVKMQDGTTYEQKFKSLSLFERHSNEQLDRSCIEAGIPDNYCVCQQFAPVPPNRTDVLGAAYFLVYNHLEARLREHLNLCHRLELERVHHAEFYEFDQTGKPEGRRHRRQVVVLEGSSADGKHRTTSRSPAKGDHNDDESGQPRGQTEARSDYLPNREYSIMFSTKPGSGLFQEVVRFYGNNMAECEAEIERARKVIEDPWAEFADRRASVSHMNGVCEFSVHSESLSRFNLYKDQSKCVTSNIELKKICYCNDLIE